MADIAADIETLEHRLMRAWIKGEQRELKSLIARDFRLTVAAKKLVQLDRPSMIDAGRHFGLQSYRLADLYVRRLGQTALLAARTELQMHFDGREWSGQFFLTDLWRKSRVTRRWSLAERTLSRLDPDAELPAHIRALQLWR